MRAAGQVIVVAIAFTFAGSGCVDEEGIEHLGTTEQDVRIYNGSVLYWGKVSHIACNSCWSCASTATNPGAIYCPGKTTTTCGEPDQYSPTQYWEPLLFCANSCPNAIADSLSDDSPIITKPTAGAAACGEQLHVCWNGRKTSGFVEDRSDAGKWEFSYAIMQALGAPNATIQDVKIFRGDPLGDGSCAATCGENCSTAPGDCPCPSGQFCDTTTATCRSGTGGGGSGSGSGTNCIPLTCQQIGYTCGQTLDGCGHTLDCGTCPTGDFQCIHGQCECTGIDLVECGWYQGSCGGGFQYAGDCPTGCRCLANQCEPDPFGLGSGDC